MSKPTKNLLEAAANILASQALDEAKAVVIDDYKKNLRSQGLKYPHPEYIKKMHDFVQGLIKGQPDIAIHPVQEEELDESIVLKNEGYGFGGTINGDKDEHVKKIAPHLKRELNNALVQHHARDRAAAKILGNSSSASVRRSKLKIGSKMMGHFLDSSHGRHLADQLNGGVKHDDPKMHAHLKQSAYHFLKDYHPSQFDESVDTSGFDQGPELDEGLHAALMGNLANGHKMKDMENELARKTRELRDLDKKHGNNARIPGTQRHFLHKHITDMQKQVDAHNEAFRKRLREDEQMDESWRDLNPDSVRGQARAAQLRAGTHHTQMSSHSSAPRKVGSDTDEHKATMQHLKDHVGAFHEWTHEQGNYSQHAIQSHQKAHEHLVKHGWKYQPPKTAANPGLSHDYKKGNQTISIGKKDSGGHYLTLSTKNTVKEDEQLDEVWKNNGHTTLTHEGKKKIHVETMGKHHSIYPAGSFAGIHYIVKDHQNNREKSFPWLTDAVKHLSSEGHRDLHPKQFHSLLGSVKEEEELNEAALPKHHVIGHFTKGGGDIVVSHTKSKVTKNPTRDVMIHTPVGKQPLLRSIPKHYGHQEIKDHVERVYSDKIKRAGGITWHSPSEDISQREPRVKKEECDIAEGFLTRTPTFSTREANVVAKITNRLNTTTGGPTAPFQMWKHDDLHQMARDHGLTEPQCKTAIDYAVKQSEAKRYGNESTGFSYRKAQKITEDVDNDLDEAVRVDDSRWKRSHFGTGQTKAAGNWMIGKHKGGWERHHKEGEDHITHNGKYSEAVKAAKAWAKSKGVDTVHIYEGSEPELGLELVESHVTIDAARNKKKRCDSEHPTTAHSVVRGRRSGKYFVVRAHSGMEHVVESDNDLQFRAALFDLLEEEFDILNEDSGIDGPAGEANVDASTKSTKGNKKDAKDAQNARTPAVTLGPVADASDGLAGSLGNVSESYLEARGTAMDKASRLKTLIKK